MPRHEHSRFENTDVVLDDNEYVHCEFIRCRLIYRGGELLTMAHCRFHGCQFIFEDAAARTMQFLRGVYHGMENGQEVVEQMFFSIRRRPRESKENATETPATPNVEQPPSE